ncbi:J domain-containing protein [Photobacterium sp. TY1-4]|uniref:J domain-containing protein n=1 Tax=Photobacterium sp. TY1-4 TaxID=2899122 RepID=UPI0021BEA713|nr:molecular chaperone DnaJ [Photobacterium sp. TY1-4]UXI00037.1 molecular chaperone DnaJ [Photobacterium sp. TY1-4]
MTTFHDILGTDRHTPADELKRRYKLLSSRLHPDKGGSKAMMQLLVQAYDKISQGKGHEEAVRTIAVKGASSERYQAQCRQLEREVEALQRINDDLTLQLQREKRQQKATEDLERVAAACEEDLKLLRRENIRLTKQLDEARRKLSESTRTVTRFEPERKTNRKAEAGTLNPLSQVSPAVLNQLKSLGRVNLRRSALMAMPLVVVAGLIAAGKAPWVSLMAMFDEPPPPPEIKMTILNYNPDDAMPASPTQDAMPVPVEPVTRPPAPRIRLINLVGHWDLQQYENLPQPYIRVRSDKGSYIVKGCDGDFQYYRNSHLRAGRLAANLIFERHDRHFQVYNIPYGNGSFATNWADSQSLLINNEYFPNQGFVEAYQQLQQRCR